MSITFLCITEYPKLVCAFFPPGFSFPAGDGCNTCSCRPGGGLPICSSRPVPCGPVGGMFCKNKKNICFIIIIIINYLFIHLIIYFLRNV